MSAEHEIQNLGSITISNDDMEQVKFWLRMFNLEAYVEAAKVDILSKPEVKRASVPIIAEYQSGRLYWYYALVLFIDSLGLSGGLGLITFADESNRKKAEARRNEVADNVMNSIGERVKEGKMSGVTLTIESGKEC